MNKKTKVALITAAGQGIGAGVARELAIHGYKVVLMSPSERSIKVAEELEGLGVQGSITDPQDLQKFVDKAVQHYGRIDAVVNNAGLTPKGDLLDLTDEAWQDGFDMLFFSVIRLMRLVTPIMQHQGGGAVVNITSFAVVEPNLGFPVSSVLRAALTNWTKLYAERFAADNIRINSVLPGYIDSLPHAVDRCEAIPMKRFGHVEELAKTVRFLLSDEASYVTGQNLLVDGGLVRAVN